MTFGPIQYEDMATLNAQWQEARPAVHGLGFSGQHEYRDVSYLNARLRPILPATVGMPPGSGSLSGNSLGASTGQFTKEQVLLAQDLMNGALAMRGMQTIKADGDLGPATCGAIKWYQDNVNPEGGKSFSEACSTVTAVPPRKKGGGTAPSTPSVPSTYAATFGGGEGDTNWMLWGGAIAAIAVGGALIYNASKKR